MDTPKECRPCRNNLETLEKLITNYIMMVVNGYGLGDLVYNIMQPTEMGIVIGWYMIYNSYHPKIYWISGIRKEKIDWVHKDIMAKVDFKSEI